MLHEHFEHQNVANSIENRGSNSRMLQIPLKWQHPAPKCCKLHQSVANSTENERFELKNAANTLETAASSSKMLQIPPTCCKIYGK
jgi:hypothetical protein